MSENMGPVPDWFAPAMDARLVPLIRAINITYNLHCADGHSRQFKIIPFINGDDPTNHSHNLPPLLNIASIHALTAAEATAYLNGYNHQVIPHLVQARKETIRLEIGCTAGVID